MFHLLPHPDFPPGSVRAVTVEWNSDDDWPGEEIGNRLLKYVVHGADALVLPEPALPRRTDGLWTATCFELFQFYGRDGQYNELNFSPSGAWAAYEFDGYRTGMRELDFPQPIVTGSHAGDRFELRADLDASVNLPCSYRDFPAAILVEGAGRKSYWALDHAPGAPDFHKGVFSSLSNFRRGLGS